MQSRLHRTKVNLKKIRDFLIVQAVELAKDQDAALLDAQLAQGCFHTCADPAIADERIRAGAPTLVQPFVERHIHGGPTPQMVDCDAGGDAKDPRTQAARAAVFELVDRAVNPEKRFLCQVIHVGERSVEEHLGEQRVYGVLVLDHDRNEHFGSRRNHRRRGARWFSVPGHGRQSIDLSPYNAARINSPSSCANGSIANVSPVLVPTITRVSLAGTSSTTPANPKSPAPANA